MYLVVLEEDITPGLSVVGGRSDSGGHIVFRVKLNNHTILLVYATTIMKNVSFDAKHSNVL